jgi:hypothetical protein
MKTGMIRVGRAVAFDAVMVSANHRVWKAVKHPLLLLPEGLYIMDNSFRDVAIGDQLRQLHDRAYKVKT